MIESLFHGPDRPYVQGSVTSGQEVRLRLRADRNLRVRKVFLRTAPEGEQVFTPAERCGEDKVRQWWEVPVRLAVPRLAYRFLVLTDEGGWWLSAAGPTRHTPTDSADFKLLPGHLGPEWVPDAIFYQVFPDRFCDGDPSTNVRTGEYLVNGRPVVARGWDAPPRSGTAGTEFYGGDLPGLVQRLPHLEDLGVTAVYLNPIFTAPSNHKYDVADYGHVDPHLGGDAALAVLHQALSDRGMRLVLDVVPNHCGWEHPWFRRAQEDPSSPEAGFFTFRSHPDEYECWLGVCSLPKLDYRTQALRDAMFEGPDAVLRRWLRPPFSIDGWRIDVANMLARQGESQLGHKIGRAIRRAVKAENPEAWLLGEHFFDGTPHLQGDELDGAMNYRGFTMPLLHWLCGFDNAGFAGKPWGDPAPLPTAALEAQWAAFRSAVPFQVALRNLNLLDSHDTPRILTATGGDRARARAAATLLFAYPGAPCVYYGDEVGMAGGRDSECRAPMVWDAARWDEEALEHHRRLCRLRRSSRALRRGGFQALLAEGDTLAFLREAENDRAVVVARRSGGLASVDVPVRAGGIADGTRFRGALGGGEVTVAGGRLAGVPSRGAEIWLEV